MSLDSHLQRARSIYEVIKIQIDDSEQWHSDLLQMNDVHCAFLVAIIRFL